MNRNMNAYFQYFMPKKSIAQHNACVQLKNNIFHCKSTTIPTSNITYVLKLRMFIFRTGTALVVVSQGVVELQQLRLQHQRQQQDQQLRQHPLGAVTCNYELFLILN